MMRLQKILLTCSISAALGGAAFAQQTNGSSVDNNPIPEAQMLPNLPSQPLGPNDLLNVAVYKCPELTKTFRVSSDGAIRLALLKSPIPVVGKLPSQVEGEIAKALVAEQIMVDPLVTVTVVEYRSRPVSVTGAVKKPVTFQAFGTIRLLDAVNRAEGFSTEAGNEMVVSVPQADPNAPPVQRHINVRDLIDRADPELNFVLKGGEEIRVPMYNRIFVAGNVKKPGEVRIQDASDTTVMKALAMSEGLLTYSQKDAYIFRRVNDMGEKQEIPIELRKIIERKSPDVKLQANDILYIPEDHKRKTTMGALDRALSTALGTASGVLVYRK